MNDRSYQILEWIFGLVARLGFPLIVGAWLLTAAAALIMGLVLKGSRMRGVIIPSLIVGGISLSAHLLDFFGTLKITPDLAIEANPIWRIVLERLGLNVARWYGLTGKTMLAILSFEFFAFYLNVRPRLLPPAARNFMEFWKKYGQNVHPVNRLVNFFAFLFALIGPFCFYIALLNTLSASSNYDKLPAMPIALAAYIFILTAVYLFGNYVSWRQSRQNNP